MKFRVPDLLLLVMIVIGGFFAVRSGQERYRLSSTVARLARKTGDLSISDPSKIYVQALPTQNPLHFAWRVYLPPNYSLNLRAGSGGLSSFASGTARDFIARVRFREDEEGRFHVYSSFAGGSSGSTFGDESLAKFLRDRWDKVQVKQLGVDHAAAFGADQTVVLLQLTLTDEMNQEALKVLSPHVQRVYLPVLFNMEFGPEMRPVVMPLQQPSQGGPVRAGSPD